MSKLLAIAASLKGILIMAGIAFVRGDMLPVILLSVLFNLVQLGSKPIGQTISKDTIVIASGHDDRSA
jgi:ABC-type glucose/galactose transport system permease subunit